MVAIDRDATSPSSSSSSSHSASDLQRTAEQSMYLALANSIVDAASLVFNGAAFVNYLKAGNNLKKFGSNASAAELTIEKDTLNMATNQYATAGTLSIAHGLIGSAAAWAIREQLDKM